METGLRGRLVVVTGGAKGIGRAIVHAFAREGARVVIADRDEAAGARVVAELEDAPLARYYPLDVTDQAAVYAVVGRIEAENGGIHVLVNNAGIVGLMPLEEMTAEEWDRVQAVNVKGVLFGMQAVVPYMKARGGGRIVNVCSQTSKMAGSLDYAHYTASKAAAWSLTMSAARRYAGIPINVNAVAPGSIVDTEFSQGFGLSMDPGVIRTSIPLGRRGTPADVAPAVVFLASDGAAYITGEMIDVNGGALMD